MNLLVANNIKCEITLKQIYQSQIKHHNKKKILFPTSNNHLHEENMYLKWNSSILSVILIMFLSGCLDSDSEDLIDKDGEKNTFEIIRRNTVMNERTDFGMTNISYTIMEKEKSGERIVNITVKIENDSDINSVGIKYWTNGGLGGGGMKKLPRENVFYGETNFNRHYLDIWVVFYEKGELFFDDLNRSYYYKNEVNYIHPFTVLYKSLAVFTRLTNRS